MKSRGFIFRLTARNMMFKALNGTTTAISLSLRLYFTTCHTENAAMSLFNPVISCAEERPHEGQCEGVYVLRCDFGFREHSTTSVRKGSADG